MTNNMSVRKLSTLTVPNGTPIARRIVVLARFSCPNPLQVSDIQDTIGDGTNLFEIEISLNSEDRVKVIGYPWTAIPG